MSNVYCLPGRAGGTLNGWSRGAVGGAETGVSRSRQMDVAGGRDPCPLAFQPIQSCSRQPPTTLFAAPCDELSSRIRSTLERGPWDRRAFLSRSSSVDDRRPSRSHPCLAVLSGLQISTDSRKLSGHSTPCNRAPQWTSQGQHLTGQPISEGFDSSLADHRCCRFTVIVERVARE